MSQFEKTALLPWSHICVILAWLFGLATVSWLAGGARGVVDNYPYVKNENPSLLQGRTASPP